MKRWSEFAAEEPDMAEAGRVLIYQFYVSGRAKRIDDQALHARYGPRPSWPPVYTK